MHMGLLINNYGHGAKEKHLFYVHSTIVLSGISFNIILIFLVTLSRKLRAVQGILFVFNLSCANCLFSSLALTTGFITANDIEYSKDACTLLTATTTFTCMAASLSRSVVAMDRYVYIADPLHYYSRSSDRKVLCLIACIWVGAACLSLTPYVSDAMYHGFNSVCVQPNSSCSVLVEVLRRNRVANGEDENCLPVPSHWYKMSILMLGVLLPLFYEVFVYTRIFYWACLHIQIMKQEANYRAQLRQRSVKESYNVDILQLQLFTRASSLMANSVFANKPSEAELETPPEMKDGDIPNARWTNTLRRYTLTSNVTSYIGSLLRYDNGGNSNANDYSKDSDSINVAAVKVVGTATDKQETSHNKPNVSFSTHVSADVPQPEDIWADEEFQKLSKSVGGDNKGSLILSSAINKLLTCTELKSGCVLFIILGTAVGCWVPFILVRVFEFIGMDKDLLMTQLKIANLFVYSLSCLDPIVYDLLHQPIRNAVKEEIRNSLTNKEF